MPVINTKKAIGITLPIERGPSGYFNQSYDIKTQVKSNLTNLILTRKKERIMQPEFGCDIQDYLFEPITPNNIAGIKGCVVDSISTWLPYVDVKNLDVIPTEDENTVVVQLFYSIRNLPNMLDSITFTFTR